MKRNGGLFNQIADVGTIMEAASLAARGKRHQSAVQRFMGNIEVETQVMVETLLDGSWLFGSYREFLIRDPKQRTIHAPQFRDRVIHHAMLLVTGRVFEKGACVRSYACRKGRGQHAALAQLRKWMRRGDWFLKLDVRKFYDSVDHQFLRVMLARRFRERRILSLFDTLLDSYQVEKGKGLPIGALTSQYLGNFYLDVIDHWLMKRGIRHVRYMDDFLLLGRRDQLLAAGEGMEGLLGNLELRAKQPLIVNRCNQGVPYLGFIIYPDRMRLDQRGRKRLRTRYDVVRKMAVGGTLAEREIQEQCQSLFAHAAKADDVNWRSMVCQLADEKKGSWEGYGTGLPRSARRLVEQHGEELPCRVSQQEQAGQPQQEQRLPCGLVLRHGDENKDVPSPDDILSCALPDGGDKTTHKSLPAAEIWPTGVKKGAGEAAGKGGAQ